MNNPLFGLEWIPESEPMLESIESLKAAIVDCPSKKGGVSTISPFSGEVQIIPLRDFPARLMYPKPELNRFEYH